MALSLRKRRELARQAVEKGNWLIRYSNDGVAKCGNGLHGQGPNAGGYAIDDVPARTLRAGSMIQQQ